MLGSRSTEDEDFKEGAAVTPARPVPAGSSGDRAAGASGEPVASTDWWVEDATRGGGDRYSFWEANCRVFFCCAWLSSITAAETLDNDRPIRCPAAAAAARWFRRVVMGSPRLTGTSCGPIAGRQPG